MSDQSERIAAARRNYRKQHNLDKARAIWGDADGTVPDPIRPGKVLVMIQASNGLFTRRSVWAPRIPFGAQPGDPIVLKYENGRLMVDGPDHPAMLSTGVNPLARQQQQASSSTTQNSVATLAVMADPVQPTLGFCIKAWNPIVNNVAYQYAGARTVDELGALALPSTGNMYYAAVFIQNDYATLEVFYSTERPVTDLPLDVDDIQECLDQKTDGSTPVWAQKLIGDQATISQNDLNVDGVPLQQVVNSDETGGSAVVYPNRASLWFNEFIHNGGAPGLIIDATQVHAAIWYNSTSSDGDEATCSFLLRGGTTYVLSVLGRSQNNLGITDWTIDGAAIGSQDWYTVLPTVNTIKTITGITVVGNGYHTIKAKINSKNAGSSGYFFLFSQIWLRDTAD